MFLLRPVPVFLAMLAVVAAGAGCTRDGPNPDGPPRVVHNRGPLPDTATLTAEWTRALPSLEGARIAALAVAPEGTVWIVDRTGTVVRFLHDDAAIQTMHPPPAWEEADVVAAAADGEGSLWLRDGRMGTVVRLTPDGDWTRTAAGGMGPLLWGRRALAVDTLDRVWVGIHPEARREAGVSSVERRALYARLEGGALVDTLPLPPSMAESCLPGRDPHFRSGWFEDFRERYLPFSQWTLLPSGALVAGCPAEYAFQRGSPGAARGLVPPVRIEMDDWARVPVTDAERRDVTSTWVAMMRNRDRPSASTWAWNGDSLSVAKPAYGALLADEEGSVWVWTAQPSTTVPANPTWPLAGLPGVLWVESGTGTFDVFAPDGRLRSHVRLPPELRYTTTPETTEPVIRGERVWAITEGPGGTPAVTRFRVTSSSSH